MSDNLMVLVDETTTETLLSLGWTGTWSDTSAGANGARFAQLSNITMDEFLTKQQEILNPWRKEPVTRGLLHELLVSLSNSKDQTDQVKYGTLADIVYDMGRSHV